MVVSHNNSTRKKQGSSMTGGSARTARLLIACPDARGIVAAVAGFVAEHGGNLLESDQHTLIDHGSQSGIGVFQCASEDLPDCCSSLDRRMCDVQDTFQDTRLDAFTQYLG